MKFWVRFLRWIGWGRFQFSGKSGGVGGPDNFLIGWVYRRAPGAQEEVGVAESSPTIKERMVMWLSNWQYSLPDTLLGAIGFIFLFTLLGGGVYVLGQTLLASGRTDYCYLTHSSEWERGSDKDTGVEIKVRRTRYMLWGHREWRPDLQLMESGSLQEVVHGAEELQCPVKIKE